MVKDCLFCKIVNKEIPAKIIAENDYYLAFHDITPQAPVHALVIPKKHYSNLNHIESIEELGALLQGVKEVAKILKVDVNYRTVLNTGREAGQEVFHVHFHILGGRQMQWPPG